MAGEDELEDKNQKVDIKVKPITLPFQSKTGKDSPSSATKESFEKHSQEKTAYKGEVR